MHDACKEGSGGKYHCSCFQSDPGLRHYPGDAVTDNGQVICSLLKYLEIVLVFKARSYCLAVEDTVGLGTRSTYRGPLAVVECTELDPRLIGGDSHRSTHGVDFPYKMSFSDSPNGRVAGHLAEGLDAMCQEQRLASHTRRGKRGLGTGMTATNHNNVEFSWVQHVGYQRNTRGAG